MSSWARAISTAVPKPPQAPAEFAPIVASATPTQNYVGEVRGFPNPLIRPAKKESTPFKVIEAPPQQPVIPEVRGFPSPIMSREQKRAARGVSEILLQPGEVRGFPSPVPVRTNRSATTNTKQATSNPVEPKVEVVQVTQVPPADNPNVTVVMTVTNNLDFMEDALLSVKRQTYSQWQGKIGLVGGTQTEEFKKRLRTLINNCGLNNRFAVVEVASPTVPSALNELSALADTVYVGFLDTADIWLPRKLDLQLKYLQEKPAVGLVGSQYRQFGEATGVVNLPAGELQKYDLTKGMPVVFSGILTRRELVNFSDELDYYEYEFCVRKLLDHVPLHNIDTVQVLKRVSREALFNPVDRHPDQVRDKYKNQLDTYLTIDELNRKKAAEEEAKKAAEEAKRKAEEAKKKAEEAAKKKAAEEAKRKAEEEAKKKAEEEAKKKAEEEAKKAAEATITTT
jgi:hypothetical protein